MNRFQRRRARALSRTFKKRVPFGRVAVTNITNDMFDDNASRIEYIHTTKGRMSRRMTMPLLDNLISIGR